MWVFSCSCLFGCSKTLRVEDSGQMRIKCRKKLDDDIESPFARSNGSDMSNRDFSGNDIVQKNRYKKNGRKLS